MAVLAIKNERSKAIEFKNIINMLISFKARKVKLWNSALDINKIYKQNNIVSFNTYTFQFFQIF